MRISYKYINGQRYKIIIDRESNSGNWIARQGDNIHVVEHTALSHQLDSDQLWEAQYMGHDNHHKFKPLRFIKLVSSDEEVYSQESLPDHASDKTINQRDDDGCRQVDNHPKKTPIGSKNSLISRGKP